MGSRCQTLAADPTLLPIMSLRRRHRLLGRPGQGLRCAGLLASVLLVVGCGTSTDMGTVTPHRVPPGAVAIVGTAPVTVVSFDHWRSIAASDPSGAARQTPSQQRRHVVAFLIRAQWLMQERQAEGIGEPLIARLAARELPTTPPARGMTHSDEVLQAHLNVIARELQSRHEVAFASSGEISRYYASHRANFTNPGLRDTLMVVTASRAEALRAKAALRGQSWATVAKRWSDDPSGAHGGAYTVIEGVQSPTLVHAVFAARPYRVEGPVLAAAAARPGVTEYFLFEVTGGRAASREPLSQVSEQIDRTLTRQAKERSLAQFTSSWERHWRLRTLCAPEDLVPECSNYHPSKAPTTN